MGRPPKMKAVGCPAGCTIVSGHGIVVVIVMNCWVVVLEQQQSPAIAAAAAAAVVVVMAVAARTVCGHSGKFLNTVCRINFGKAWSPG